MNSLLSIGLVLALVDKVTSPLKGVTNAVNGIGNAANTAAGKFGRLQQQVDKLGASAQKLDGLGKPLMVMGAIGAAGIQKTISEFATLEEAQNRLKTNLMDAAGKVGPEYEKLNRLAEKLGTDLPGSTKEMVEMFTALREQGVQTNMILGGMGEATAKFAAVMKLPFAEAATHVAKFSENMGIADKDANAFMDTIQRLKSSSGVEVGDLAYTFKYAGASLKMLNLQGIEAAQTFSTVIGVLANAGIEGSTAGTNMSQALSRMAEIGHRLDRGQVKKLVAPVLDKYGVELEFFNAQGQFKGLREMTAELEKLKALNPQEQILVLKKLFGDEAARPLAVLMKSGVAGFDAMAKRMQQQADMQQKIKTIMDGTKMKWETLTGTVANFVAHVGGVFARLINLPGLLDKINTLFGKMDGWVLAHPKLAGILGGVVLAVTGLSLAAGTMLVAIAAIGATVPAAVTGLATLGNGASIASVRLAALAARLKAKWVISKLPDSMFGDVIPGTAKAQGSITAFLGQIRAGFIPGIRAAMVAMRAFSLTLITSPIGWIGLAVAGAALLIYKYWKPISGFFKGVWQGLKEGLKGLAPAWDVFKKIAPILFPILTPLKWIWNAVKALLKPVEDTGGAAQNMGVRFGKALAGILTTVLTLPAKMLSAGFNIVNSLFEGMKKAINKPVELMKGLAQRLRNFLPFSPAKEGPLKDIHRIRLIETIADSMKPAPMVAAMRTVTAATMLATAAPVMAGRLQPATIPAVGGQIQQIQQAVKAAQVVQPPALVQPIKQALQPATIPAVGGQNKPGATQITYAPVINLAPGTPAEARSQVEQALKLSQVEFERMLARAEQNKQRKGFA
jgi:TP901 family phage tail tape measure protein